MIENLGWYLFLGAIMTIATLASKLLIALVDQSGAQGKSFYFADFLIAAGLKCYAALLTTKLASACALAVFTAILLFTSASAYSALGYAFIAYFIGGVATPVLLRDVKASADSSTAPTVDDSSE